MEAGKHKKKINYTIMIISDSPDGGMSPIYLRPQMVASLVALILVIAVAAVGAAAYFGFTMQQAGGKDTQQQEQIVQLTEENRKLTEENSELSDKVSILSDKVAQNEETKEAQEKEEEEQKIPSGFPLAGPAVILESSEMSESAAAEDGGEGEAMQAGQTEPIVVFSASVGTKVMAAARGVIAAVEEDPAFGRRVVIDHENGYQSIYRIAAEPLVREGDEVNPGTALYEMQSPDERFGYQITQEGTLVDPLDLLEVYG